MAQPKPVEKPADCGAVQINATLGEFDAESVERQFSIPGNTGANPSPCTVSLPPGGDGPALLP